MNFDRTRLFPHGYIKVDMTQVIILTIVTVLSTVWFFYLLFNNSPAAVGSFIIASAAFVILAIALGRVAIKRDYNRVLSDHSGRLVIFLNNRYHVVVTPLEAVELLMDKNIPLDTNKGERRIGSLVFREQLKDGRLLYSTGSQEAWL